MDCRVCLILGLLCGSHGSHELRISPFVRAQAALHGRLHGVHRIDLGLCNQGMWSNS